MEKAGSTRKMFALRGVSVEREHVMELRGNRRCQGGTSSQGLDLDESGRHVSTRLMVKISMEHYTVHAAAWPARSG